jgi:hypothetical protein
VYAGRHIATGREFAVKEIRIPLDMIVSKESPSAHFHLTSASQRYVATELRNLNRTRAIPHAVVRFDGAYISNVRFVRILHAHICL